MSSPLRVLIADDNRIDRTVLARIVRRAGYEAVEAVDGEDALARFRTHRPDLVLLDALMPRLDGFAVARQIKLEAGEALVPIIFLTSLTEPEALARALRAGGDDFLSKPYNPVVLEAKLNALQRMRTMHATMQRQRDEIGRHHARLLQEQAAAKAIFDSVTRSSDLDAPFIRHLISPLSIFNGDVLLAALTPAGDLHVLLGDFTGHGLAAAVGAMPLAELFYGMTAKGFPPARILREANRKLLAILPKGFFCCATLAALRFGRQALEYWNGGLPPGCIVRSDGSIERVESRHLPLGIQSDERFDAQTSVVPMIRGERLLLFTDGIVDARNVDGEAFGHARLDDLVRSAPGGSPFDAVRRAVLAHLAGQGSADDLALVEVTMAAAPAAAEPAVLPGPEPDAGEAWVLTWELGPRSLRRGSPLPMLQQLLLEFPAMRRHVGTIHTVLTELYTNAVDHGLLGLDSALKSTADGFAAYYRARARAMASLDGWVRFRLCCEADERAARLRITVTDSGRGFDHAALAAVPGDPGSDAYHGRGLALLRRLCREVHHRGRGNEVEVLLVWDYRDA